MRIPTWDLYVSNSRPFAETQSKLSLRIKASGSGQCDACTRGYHAGEEIAVDPEVRVLHWYCHLRETEYGGRLLDWHRRENR